MDPSSEVIWKKNYKINNWNVYGNSVAGLRTSFYISDLNILLDGGYQNFYKPDNIFITHLHADHIANLHLTILENNNNKVFTNIYCPLESTIYLERFLEAFFVCNYSTERVNFSKIFRVHGFVPGQKKEIILNKKKFIVEALKSNHVIQTLSYGFNFVSKKLKDEYKDKTGEELVNIKKSGIDIVHEVTTGVLLFVGDTDSDIFNNSSFYNYSNIIIECTFFDINDIETSKERKHMHWKFLEKVIKKEEHINFHIIHISPKHLNNYSSFIENKINNLNFLY